MKRTFLLFTFLSFLTTISATNVGIEVKAQVDIKKDIEIALELAFEATVSNLLYLNAEFFNIDLRIFTDSLFSNMIHEERLTDTNLDAYTNRKYQFEQKFTSMVPGKYYGYASVYYENDIDRSNDTTTFQITFVPKENECIPEVEYLAGQGFRVEKNLTYFPGNSDLATKMQRGDVIGLSALVTDYDITRQLCICGDDTSSTNWGPFADEVIYEWSLEGEGKLLKPISNNELSSVLYEIPICVDDPFTAIVTLKVRNSLNSLVADKEIVGTFEIYVTSFPPGDNYGNMNNKPDAASLLVSVKTNNLKNGENSEIPDERKGNCTPLDIKFEKGRELNIIGDVKEFKGKFCNPDYAALLTVEAEDEDRYIMKCFGDEGCESTDSIATVTLDQLKYEWEIIGGKGTFPMGNIGRSVVFHKSRSSGAFVKCTVSNTGKKYDDEPKAVIIELKAAEKPKAFVGVGDDEDNFAYKKLLLEAWDETKIVHGGKHGGFLTIAESMKDKYEAAGYDVDFRKITKKEDIEEVLQDPLFQAFAIVSHGFRGKVHLSDDPKYGNLQYNYTNFTSSNKLYYGCKEHPRIRDLQLLSCEAFRGKWREGLHRRARLHGWTTEKFIASFRFYAFVTYEPLTPINLSLP